MRRIYLFLAILITSLVALITVSVISLAAFSYSPWNWSGMGGMMGNGGMMGGNGGTVTSSATAYFVVAFIVLIGVVVVGIVGLVYYIAVPEIRTGVAPVVCETIPKENTIQNKIIPEQHRDQPKLEQGQEISCTPLESIVKTLTEDERKVVEVLRGHNGKYLQKYIRNETGLSRLQTHRIVARLAERGIVTLEKTGNTNQVLLADWLKQ
jgi:predicted transcriptional regulator